MRNTNKTWRALLLPAAAGLLACQAAYAEEFSVSMAKAWLAAFSVSAAAEVPGPAAAPATRAEARSIFRGRIKKITLAGEGDPQNLQGTIAVEAPDGTVRSFLVRKYTFILVVSLTGYGYAGELRQLEPGWKCDVAYDVPPSDDWNTDKASAEDGGELKDADNMTVYYKR